MPDRECSLRARIGCARIDVSLPGREELCTGIEGEILSITDLGFLPESKKNDTVFALLRLRPIVSVPGNAYEVKDG